MLRLLFKTAVIFIFFLSACKITDFEPRGDHYVEVAKPAPIQIQFGVKVDQPRDTLILWDEVSFEVIASAQVNTSSDVLVYLDDKPLSYQVYQNIITINTTNFENGFHVLSFVYLIKTQSHSLADNLNMEFYSARIDLPVIIDNRAPHGNFNIIRVETEHGAPVIYWTEYPYANFQELILMRELETSEARILSDTLAVIYDRTVTHWTDSTYVGGKADYYAILKAKGQTIKTTKSHIEFPLPSFKLLTVKENGQIEIHWEILQYPYNFGNYIIKKGIKKYHDYIEWRDDITINDIYQTSFIDSFPIFGEPMMYHLIVEAHGQYFLCDAEIMEYGKKLPYVSSVSYVPTRDEFCIFGQDDGGNYTNFFIDEATFNLQKFNDYFIAFSPNGELAFKKDNSKNGDVVYRVDPNHPNQILDRIKMKNGYGNPPRFLYFSVTNNGYLAFNDEDGSMVYDALNKWRILYKYEYANTGRLQRISPNGKYALFGNGWIYRIAINKFQKLYHLTRAEQGKMAFSEDGEQLIVTDKKKIAIYQAIDKSLIREFSIPADLYGINLDPVSKNLGGFTRTPQSYRIYDLETGVLIKEIPVAFEDHLYGTTLFYWAKNTLFTGEYLVGSYFMKIYW